MGVSNVYNQAKANAIAAIKSNLSAKGTKKAEALKPDHMKMTGSIFNAPGAKDAKPTSNIADLNTRASLAELNKKPVEETQSKGSNSKNPDSFADIDNASDGKAAANSVSAQGDKVKAYTAKTQQEAGVVARMGSSAEKLDGKIEDANKKFTAQNVKLEAQIKSDNAKLERAVKDNEETQKEVDDAQHELDSLLARNSFSMGGANGSSGSSDDASKINELQTFIGAKVGVMQSNGKVIYSLQRSQSRTLNQMSKTNTQYIKTHQRNAKNLKAQQAEDSKIIKTATTIEQYSMLAQVSGQTLSLAGKGLMALGAAIPYGFGAALVAIGQVMDKVGTVVELVGQYGQTAANLTKTAAYAAEGNIMGAMQSAASAMQSGAAAAKGTVGLKDTFGKIDQQATEATNKIAANQIAKDQVNKEQLSNLAQQNGIDAENLTGKELEQQLKDKGVSNDVIKNAKKADLANGMTAKQARQATATNLRNHFNNDTLDGVTSNHNQNGRLKQLKNEATKRYEVNTEDATGKITGKTTTSHADLAFLEANNDYYEAFKHNGYTISQDGTGIIFKDKDGKVVQVTDQKEIKNIRKQIGKQAKTSFKNTTSSNTKKSSTNWADNMNKFTQTMGSMAQMYMMFNGGGSAMGMGGMTGMGGSMMGMGGNMMGMNGMGYSNRMGYSNGTYMTDSQRRAAWQQRNPQAKRGARA